MSTDESRLRLFTDEGSIGVLSLMREAIGEHYDVRLEEETSYLEGALFPVVHEFVVRIYDKGGTTPKLTLWLP